MKVMEKKLFISMYEQMLKNLNQQQGYISTRELIAQLYTKNLENKSKEQGLLMADEVSDAVREFHKEYTDAVKDSANISERVLIQLMEGKTLPERCSLLAQLCTGIATAEVKQNEPDGEEMKSLLYQVKDKLLKKSTPELEAKLREQAVALLRGNTILSCNLLCQAEELENLAIENGLGQLVFQVGDDEWIYEDVLTMLTYIAVKKGESKLPPDMTIRETAYIVGATVEQMRIAYRVELGDLALNVGIDMLNILSTVLILRLATHLLGLGASLSIGLVGLIIVLPTTAMMIMMMVMLLNLVLRHNKNTFENMADTSKLSIKTNVRVVALGLRRLAEFFPDVRASSVSTIWDKTIVFLREIESSEVHDKSVVWTNAQE